MHRVIWEPKVTEQKSVTLGAWALYSVITHSAGLARHVIRYRDRDGWSVEYKGLCSLPSRTRMDYSRINGLTRGSKSVPKHCRPARHYHYMNHLLHSAAGPTPAYTGRWPNIGLMLGQRLRRWTNISPILGQHLVYPSIHEIDVEPIMV